MAQSEIPANIAEIDPDLTATQLDDTASSQTQSDPADDAVVITDPPVDEIAELKKQLEEANRGKADAEARANSLSTEKAVAESRVATEVNNRFAVQEGAIETRLNSAKSTLDSSKRELARAYSEQRYEDVAELQGQITAATIDQRQAEWEKSQIGAYKARAAQEIEATQNRSRDPQDSFLASIPGDRSRQWLRDHPDILRKVVASPTEAKRLFGFANIAEANGNSPDSDSYFDSIETQYGLKETGAAVTTTAPAKPAPKPPGNTAAAAPSTRSAQPAANRDRVVKLDDVVRKLTQTDRANAKFSFPDKPQEEAEKLFAQGLVISKQRDPGFRPDIRL